MSNTSRNPVVVVKGGVTTRLDTLAYNISTKNGIVAMSGLRGSAVIVPGRHGSLYRAGKKREEGMFILSMWAHHGNTDGVAGADKYATWRSNMDTLLRLFDTSRAQILIREYITSLSSPGAALPSTGYRQALCEVRGAIDPEVIGKTFGKFNVACVINDVFWEGDTVLTYTSPTGASAIATHTITTFDGSTAPIEDSIIVVDGPITDPTITDILSGHQLKLVGTVAAGQQWQVDSGRFRSNTGASLEFNTTGGTSAVANTVVTGIYAPRYFGLTTDTGVTQVSLAGTAVAAATRLRIQARKKFH